MSREMGGPSPEEMGIKSETRELSPEEQKVADGLKNLAEEKNQMAIRVLAEYDGEFHTEGIGFTLLRNKGENLQNSQLQIEGPDKNEGYNFGSWKGNLDGLAKKLVDSGLTADQLNVFIEHVQGTATRLEKKGDKWIIDGEKTVGE